jgi:hypothetical protein
MYQAFTSYDSTNHGSLTPFQGPLRFVSPAFDKSAAVITGTNSVFAPFSVHDNSPPTWMASFDYQNGPVPRVAINFNEPVATLSPANISVVDEETNSSVAVQIEGAGATQYIRPTAIAAFPDGNYRLTIPASAITDLSGNHGADALTLDFFALAGDANHDRSTNALDFNLVAASFGKTGTNFGQGDFNYDGTVNSLDFAVSASGFGSHLSPPATPLGNVIAPSPARNISASEPDLFSNKKIGAMRDELLTA